MTAPCFNGAAGLFAAPARGQPYISCFVSILVSFLTFVANDVGCIRITQSYSKVEQFLLHVAVSKDTRERVQRTALPKNISPPCLSRSSSLFSIAKAEAAHS